jgi:hypothetical protein
MIIHTDLEGTGIVNRELIIKDITLLYWYHVRGMG